LIPPALFNLYVNDMPMPSQNVEFSLYAEEPAIVATSRKPMLLVGYLQTYISILHRRLAEWRNAINVSKYSSIIFA
jgi:hypothetical protein